MRNILVFSMVLFFCGCDYIIVSVDHYEWNFRRGYANGVLSGCHQVIYDWFAAEDNLFNLEQVDYLTDKKSCVDLYEKAWGYYWDDEAGKYRQYQERPE